MTIKDKLRRMNPHVVALMTKYDVAKRLGCSHDVARLYLHELGLKHYKLRSNNQAFIGTIADLCEAYAEKLNRCFMSVTEVYHMEKSTSALGRKWDVDGDTIVVWVKKEGGKAKPKGGPRRKGRLKAILSAMPTEYLLSARTKTLAEKTGYSPSHVGLCLRQMGLKGPGRRDRLRIKL